MGEILEQVQAVFRFVMQPVRWLMESAGIEPADIQVWTMIVAIFMIAIYAPTTYGDLVLRRRQRHALGTVVSIDRSDDGATPRIGFRDAEGRTIEFDSPLAVNHRTRAVGGVVDVIYDPLHPARAREANRVLSRLFAGAIWYGIAVGVAVFSVS